MDAATLLAERVKAAVVRAFGPEQAGADPAVHRSNFADFQADAALRLAKPLKRPPLELAKAIAEAFEGGDLVENVSVSPPGFVNFTLAKGFLETALAEVAADARHGVRAVARPETVTIDYSSPNIAKEMHVGHIRSTVIGDSLARVLGFLGHRVIRQNHVGDWGTPFGMLIEHLVDLGTAQASSELSVGALNQFYQAARKKFDGDPAFAERARKRVVSLQAGDAETLAYWAELVDASRRYFGTLYARLDVELEDGDVRGESFYNPMLAEVAEDLERRGIARVDAGALCVFLDEFKGRDGAPLPLIVRKQDGGFGYAATDVAAVRYRVRELGATRLLYVIGAPQQQHLAMVFATCRKAGYLPDSARAEHVAFGSILGKDKKMFKTRDGETVRLVDLLDEAVERAQAAVREKNPELGDAEVKRMAEAVGIGAVKYADLSSDRIKDSIFDFDRMLAFEGNTGPYLQYAHARLASLERKAAEEAIAGSAVRLGEEPERRLALELVELEPVLRSVGETLQPHKLATYLYGLATAFTEFYEKCPVLRAPDAATRASRLTLSRTTRSVLGRGL
ncbi:MAG TPA: arginine--tRNA ligase, partial [Polyangiaceae bacterium]